MPSIFGRSLETLRRNYALVLPVVFTLGLFLLLVNVFLFLSNLSENALRELSGKITFSVYIKKEANFIEVKRLIDDLEKLETVQKPVIYTSSGAAQKMFEGSLGFTDLADVDFPSTLKITPKHPDGQKIIRAFLENGPYAGLLNASTKSVQSYEEKAFEKAGSQLAGLEKLVKNVLSLIFFIVIVTGLFMLYALLKLETHTRKSELFVMKLVGAPANALEMPFLVESALIGALGWIFGVIFTLLLPVDPLLKSAYSAMPFANILIFELFAMFILSLTAGWIFLWRMNSHKYASFL